LTRRATLLFCLTLLVMPVLPAFAQDDDSTLGFVTKLGAEVDIRSGARVLADEFQSGNVVLPELAGPITGIPVVPQIQLRGGNTQVNNLPGQTIGIDYTQIFTGFRPFVHATQSEVSAAAFGRNVVATYNNSAGLHLIPNPNGPGLLVDQVQLSGFSVSQDGGQTWSSGFIPPSITKDASGNTFVGNTFGDPSVGVDRSGNFYFANLASTVVLPNGKPPQAHGTIQVNKSTDGGQTWSPGAVVQIDDASDKEWLAVGPDPVHKNQDNVYVTWTSFQQAACELRFGRSTDGGATWTAKTIYVPTADPNDANPQNCLQFSNPVVDGITGTLYVPFLHFSNSDQDFIQMLVSNDAGETFHFATFNIPGAPNPTVMPITQPGELTECNATRQSNGRFSVNLRLTIHAGTNVDHSLTGLRRFVNASRLTVQPALAARNGTLYLAWSNSTSLSFGDPNGHSNIMFVRSDDGGNTWTSAQVVNPVTSDDVQHVLPALAIDQDPNDVHISYYTQHSNGTVDLDMANSHDRGSSFPTDRTVRVTSESFNLPPTNIPIPSAAQPFATTNYDREIAQCYALGEYQSVFTANGSVYAGWGDMRNLMTEPVNALSPISGQTHSQEDVMVQKVKAQ
jgi:hypothetical protein